MTESRQTKFTAPHIGGLQEFRLYIDRWSTYVIRLKAWLGIQNIKSSEYSKYLVAVVGTEPLDLIVDLCHPDQPDKVPFDTIVKLVEEHLSPKRSIIAERMLFRSYKQGDGQAVTDYLVHLKKLSKPCKFLNNDILNENLRDQFVYGLSSERIRQRLLTEEGELTFLRATELALSLEAAVRDSRHTVEEQLDACAGSPPVFALAQRRRGGGKRVSYRGRGADARTVREPAATTVRCYRCDGEHRADICFFIKSECYVCGAKGHIAKMCRYRKQKGIHRVSDEECDNSTVSSESEEAILDVNMLSDSDTIDNRWNMRVKVNNTNIVMECDTGSAVSVVSLGTYNKYFKKCKLVPCTSNLKMYSGHKVKLKGKFLCNVQTGNRVITDLYLVVIDNVTSPSLLGRNWMRSFGITFPHFKSMNRVLADIPSHSDVHSELLKRFPGVFTPGIGIFNKSKFELRVPSGAQPVWQCARPVLHALLPAVNAELTRVQRESIIEREQSTVDWRECVTPIEPVIKKNDEIGPLTDFRWQLSVPRRAQGKNNVAIHVTPPDGEEDDEFVPPLRARRKMSTPLSALSGSAADGFVGMPNLLRSSPTRSLSPLDRTKRRFSTMVTSGAAAAVSRRLSATIGWCLATPTHVKPQIVRQGRALCLQYIKIQIRRSSLCPKKQIVMKRLQQMVETECGEEALCNIETGVLMALRALCSALERKRPDAFRRVARQATRAPSAMLRSDTALAELSLALARRITRDSITWSKIAAVYCICGALAKEAAEAADAEPALELISAPAAAIADLLHEEPGSWIASHGGWNGLIERLRASERDQRSEKTLRVMVSFFVMACLTLFLLRWVLHAHPAYYDSL